MQTAEVNQTLKATLKKNVRRKIRFQDVATKPTKNEQTNNRPII